MIMEFADTQTHRNLFCVHIEHGAKVISEATETQKTL